MKRYLLFILVFYILEGEAQKTYPLEAIKRTSLHEEPLDMLTYTTLPISSAISVQSDGAAAVGQTMGNLSMSEAGAVVYTILIAIPRGTREVAPTLVLTYNDRSGNGIAGYGWHLMGLSVISRVGSTKYHNGKISKVNFTSTDQFALDERRLLLKEGIHDESSAMYEIETFPQVRTRVVGESKNAAFGPDYFEVLYPNGAKVYYGRNLKGSRAQNLLEYALSHWEDTQGVSIEYFYTTENSRLYIDRVEYGGKEKVPHTINFKYKARNRIESACVGGSRFINYRLLSEIRATNNNADYRKYTPTYNTNALSYNRLVAVEGMVGGEKYISIELRHWDTARGFKNNNFKLEVPLVGVDNQNSVIVPLDLDGDNHIGSVMYPTIGEDVYKKVYLFDVFRKSPYQLTGGLPLGYTFKDISPVKLVLSTGKSFDRRGIATTHQEGDKVVLNSYAKPSMIALSYQNIKEWKLPTYEDRGRSYCNLLIEEWKKQGGPPYVVAEKKNTSYNDLKFLSGDFNGDGLTDIIAIEYPTERETCFIQMPSLDQIPFEPTCERCEYTRDGRRRVYWVDLDKRNESEHSEGIGNMQESILQNDLVMVMDVNGDGKTDIIYITEGVLFVYETDNYRHLHLLYRRNSNYIKLGISHPMVGDFDGDGKIDFSLPTANGNKEFSVFTNTRKGFNYELKRFSLAFIPKTIEEVEQVEDGVDHYTGDPIYYDNHYYRNHFLIPIDVNNDGRTDIVQYESTRFNLPNTKLDQIRNIKVSNNRSEGTELSFVGGASKRPVSEFPAHIIFSAPDERNGVMDISFFSGNLIETAYLQENNKEELLLREVYNGGVQEKISYKPMVFDADIEKEPIYKAEIYSENYPYVAVINMQSVRLVSKLEREGASISKTEHYFAYYNAITNTEGLGFLGFIKIGSTN